MTRGLGRFDTPQFGMREAQIICDLIEQGRRDEADERLRQYVHTGVTPTELFETGMALQRQIDGAG